MGVDPIVTGARTRLSTSLAGVFLLVLVVALGDVDYAADPEDVVIDLSSAQVWDASTLAALDAITNEHATRGKRVTMVGLDEHSTARFERHTGS